jgi:WD40 repeat protein
MGCDGIELPGALQIWDLATGQLSVTPEGILIGVVSVAFSPDGKRLAAAADYHQGRWTNTQSAVRVWDTDTWQLVYNLRGHPSAVFGVAFSPDGTRLASAGGQRNQPDQPGEVNLWDMHTGQAASAVGKWKRPRSNRLYQTQMASRSQ